MKKETIATLLLILGVLVVVLGLILSLDTPIYDNTRQILVSMGLLILGCILLLISVVLFRIIDKNTPLLKINNEDKSSICY